jgi:hypothetical protein
MIGAMTLQLRLAVPFVTDRALLAEIAKDRGTGDTMDDEEETEETLYYEFEDSPAYRRQSDLMRVIPTGDVRSEGSVLFRDAFASEIGVYVVRIMNQRRAAKGLPPLPGTKAKG